MKCGMMSAVIAENKKALGFLEQPGQCERTFTWTDQPTGIRIKCRPDKLLDCNLVVNLKTCADSSPRAFLKTVRQFGYHRSAALEVSGILKATGIEPDFMWVAVETEPPHVTRCYSLDSDTFDEAYVENTDLLDEIAERRRNSNWSDRYANQVVELSLVHRKF
jgi:exodeoxyribonuclease VIII